MIRDYAEMTQKEFAEMLAIPQPTLGGIESGARQATRDVADAIFLASGADPESIFTPWFEKDAPGAQGTSAQMSAGNPRESWSGREYTPKSWKAWSEALAAAKPITKKRIIEILVRAEEENLRLLKQGDIELEAFRLAQVHSLVEQYGKELASPEGKGADVAEWKGADIITLGVVNYYRSKVEDARSSISWLLKHATGALDENEN